MTFEAALFAEIIALTEIENVYPIVGKQDGPFPFVTYRKNRVSFVKTLDGILKKAEATYDIVIVAQKYPSLQAAYDSILTLFFGFYSRTIGTNGPLITNVNVDALGDRFDPETGYYLSELQLKVNY